MPEIPVTPGSTPPGPPGPASSPASSRDIEDTSPTRRARARGSEGDDSGGEDRNPELPDRASEGKPRSVEAAERALVARKPRIGDTMPAPVAPTSQPGPSASPSTTGPVPRGLAANPKRDSLQSQSQPAEREGTAPAAPAGPDDPARRRRRGGRGRGGSKRVTAEAAAGSVAGPEPRRIARPGRRADQGAAPPQPVRQVLYDD